MKRILKKRLRLQPVVLAVSGSLEKQTLKTIRKALELSRRSVFTCDIPLNLGYVFGIEGKIPEHLRNELLFTPFKPQPNPTIDNVNAALEVYKSSGAESIIALGGGGHRHDSESFYDRRRRAGRGTYGKSPSRQLPAQKPRP